MVTFLGGTIGVIVGVGVSQLISLSGVTQAAVTTHSILLSFFVSAIVGIAFGYFPAQKAAKLHPIDALRYE